MAFQAAPKSAMVQLVMVEQGQRVENVFHVSAPTDFDVPMLSLIPPEIKSWWAAQGHLARSTEVAPTLIIVTALHSVGAPAIEVDWSDGVTGADVAQALPMNVTVAVSLHTGIRGRSFNGRLYHIGLTAAMVVDSQLQEVMKPIILSQYQNLVSRLAGLETPMSILSRVSGKALRATAIATVVTTVTLDGTLDSQRRRLPGRGR
jgi:hypothetical protein